MDWIFDNLKLIVILIVAISWVMGLRKSKQDQQSEDHSRDRQPSSSPPIDAEQQVRRIQEEIRRKIQQRREGGDRSGEAVPPPLPPFLQESPRLPREQTSPPELTAPRSQAYQRRLEEEEESERQRQLAEQLRHLELQRREARRTAQQLAEGRGSIVQPVPATTIGLNDLRDPGGLRRAIVLQEILGKPVSMR